MSNREYNDGEWTEARWRAFIISAARAGMRRYPPKWKAFKEAGVGKKVNKHSGRMAEHYLCADCGGFFVARDVQVDHVDPVVDPSTGFVSWETYFDRLYCETDNLQVLCKPCHKEKTNRERKERKKK
jgi:5-methylcytosine-specific restriction endonuclease McrA